MPELASQTLPSDNIRSRTRSEIFIDKVRTIIIF